MPQVRNILVPIDTHENALPVVQWAVVVARATESQLTLLHVNESLELMKDRPGLHGGGLSNLDLTLDKWRQQYQRDARAAVNTLVHQQCGGLSVSQLIMEGRAPATILGAIETTRSDLVVMGTHGRPWYQRAFLGSTAEAVLRAAEVPVWILHNRESALPPPRMARMLFATDFSPASGAGEEWWQYLTHHGVREVVLVHAVENPLLDIYSPDAADFNLEQVSEESRQHPPRSAQPYWENARQVAKAKLSQSREQLLAPPSPVRQAEIVVAEGAPAAAILEAAEQQQVDCLVLATHGRSGIRRFVLGSVTEKVVRGSSRPVLAVPSR
jgi:nucleotide-binding universal stress UspA family protein